jgi:hypothetical protein
VQGWEPKFPCTGTPETDPGTIFVTGHRGRRCIWTVVRCETGRTIEYATVTPEEQAGLITVTCQASPAGTEATVSYDVTALSPRANGQVGRFANDFPSFLHHWELAIAAAVEG